MALFNSLCVVCGCGAGGRGDTWTLVQLPAVTREAVTESPGYSKKQGLCQHVTPPTLPSHCMPGQDEQSPSYLGQYPEVRIKWKQKHRGCSDPLSWHRTSEKQQKAVQSLVGQDQSVLTSHVLNVDFGKSHNKNWENALSSVLQFLLSWKTCPLYMQHHAGMHLSN